ncbi:dipeptide ABC transporter ATP-binding protein [Thorsellia anophelis]|uniref:Microcin C transport system ATP-binding protein n=1 Tax=Thorsellia anophelis DSM 18579 TaxID=1123402 RepID=A0A1H9ZTN3_9GAMM|nr:dipeptide ABC transporter ATP-binding protein [Thorsellia anophelis]SES85140.1 microcin C transport system ATP-binding protein [Thorsellia anophelis DSM 18579]
MANQFQTTDIILKLVDYEIKRPVDLLYSVNHVQTELVNDNLVTRLNIEVFRNEILAIVGESGSGKSLTAHGILQLLPHKLIKNQSGSIFYNNLNITTLDQDGLRQLRHRDIAIIFQEPMVALNPVQTIGKQLEEILTKSCNNKNLPSSNTHRNGTQVINILTKVGLKDPELRINNYPHQFSGGERQRIIIAMALLRNPKILIADEATTALDVTTQKQIIDLLLQLKKEYGMTLIFISHNLHLVRKIADRVAVMYRGSCIEIDSTENIFNQPQTAYTQSLIDAHNNNLKLKKNQHTENITSTKNEILSIKGLSVAITHKKGWFSKSFKPILENFELNLKQGSTLGLVGESGSGKSTTAFAITKLIKSTGCISINGVNTSNLSEKAFKPIRRDIQIIFQDPFSTLNPKRTVQQTIEEGLEVHEPNLTIKQRDELVCNIMQEIGLDPETRNRYPHQFSGGQRQRIAIARALILKPKLLILDEPTSALDKKVEMQILDLLNSLQLKYKLSYLFISHDLATVRLMCENIIVLKEGKIIEAGTTESIFMAPKEQYTQELINAALID